ncbi:MAG TPA: hypothetical protein PLC48_04400 [Ferruginibacter sp.]|nr:hypothetical protein [Ferruginibacter sp.]
MKKTILFLFLLQTFLTATAQKNFIGIIKYRLTVEGGSETITDSMTVIFDNDRVKLIFYLPESLQSTVVNEKAFIDDFSEKSSYSVDPVNKSYKRDTLKPFSGFDFINTRKFASANNNICFVYQSTAPKNGQSVVNNATCLASIDYQNNQIKDYAFLGFQPFITDNRIILDFTTMLSGGKKSRFYVYEITPLDNVDFYFDLWGFRKVQ